MGRAERRKRERRERIENKKGKILLSSSELNQIKEQIRDDQAQYNVDSLMTCFALAEHRLYGFGRKRISRTLMYIDEMMGDVVNGKATIEDFKEELRNETNIIIKSE